MGGVRRKPVPLNGGVQDPLDQEEGVVHRLGGHLLRFESEMALDVLRGERHERPHAEGREQVVVEKPAWLY